MTSPLCTVQDGAGAALAPPSDVTVGNTITVQLIDLSCNVWSISIVGQDELVAVPTLTVNNTTKTATFTAPAAGSALILQSQVNNGKDANGNTVAAYTTKFGIYTLASGKRVFATNERAEGNAAFGWITKLNPVIRTGGGGGAVPTGTGFYHTVGGVMDAAAFKGTAAQLPVMNAGGTDFAMVSIGGACTLAASGTLSFATGAFGALALSTTSTLSVGASPAAAGTIRIPTTTVALAANNAGGSADLALLATDASDQLFVGSNAAAGLKVSNLYLRGATAVYFGPADDVRINASSLSCAQPILGFGTAWGSVDQMFVKSMAGATYTLANTEYIAKHIKVTGTGSNTIKLPAATDAQAYTKYIWNAGSGTLAVNDSNSVAMAATLAAGTGAWVLFANGAVKQLTAAFTVA